MIIKLLSKILIIFALLTIFPHTLKRLSEVRAATAIPPPPPPPKPLPANFGQEDVNGIIPGLPNFTLAQAVTLIIRLLFIIAFGLLLIVFLYGGIRWLASAGDLKAVSGTQHLLTAALVGIIIVIASFALIRLIEFFFKVSIISAPLNVPQI